MGTDNVKRQIYFISKSANWQKYRFEFFNKLAHSYDLRVKILTTGKLKSYLGSNDFVKYEIFKSFLPVTWKLSFFPGALIYIIKNRPYAIVAQNDLSGITEYCVLLLSKVLRIKFVFWTLGYDHFPHSNSLFYRGREGLLLFLAKYADSIITYSKKGEDYLVDKKVAAPKIVTAPNTLDTDRIFKEISCLKNRYDERELFKQLGFSPNDKIVVYSGRLQKRKKIDLGIRSINELAKIDNNIRYLIVGSGPEEDYLKRISGENIVFKGEIYDSEAISKYFLISKLFLCPGWTGLAIVHAFCFGLPFITVKGHHAPEIQYLVHGFNGYYLEENEISRIDVYVKELIYNETLSSRMSKNAFKTAQNEASIRHMLSGFYRAILED